MKKIVEKSLEAALIKASSELNCSVADLEYEVIQNPSSGFLGIGKKEAIIIVDTKAHASQAPAKPAQTPESNPAPKAVAKPLPREPKRDSQTNHSKVSEERDSFASLGDIWGSETTSKPAQTSTPDKANVAQIYEEIKGLFALLPFEIDTFEVRMLEENTLFVYLDGRDCALLIGERGYRYKALSYLLFNWINPKYGYSLRLEIAEFLKNQEEMIDVYLRDIVRLIKLNGKAQTKPLDGILVYIALNKLREMFPDKYVSVRQNDADEKYIIINDFRR